MLRSMPTNITNSSLLSSITGLKHGFLTNHAPDARLAHDLASPEIATVNQVHGHSLLWATTLEKRQRNADALATSTKNLAVGVYSADCTPVLVAAVNEDNSPLAVMAVHAGWRGTALGILGKSFAEFAAQAQIFGATRFFAAIGPSISFESFEVGEEVVKAFPGSLERGIAKLYRAQEGEKKYLFDLPGENYRQIKDSAARRSLNLEIETLPLCTFKLKEQLPSYRRDREKAGRILSYLSFER